MPRKPEDLAIYAAPALFVALWASGFVGAKFGLPYIEPLTFLTIRMIAVVSLLAILALATRPPWPDMTGIRHSIVAGLLVHGAYLGGVFVAIDRRLPAGLSALVVSLQPVLTSTIANRFLGERVIARQWLGLALGIAGVYLVVVDKTVAGEATALGWAAAVVALIGITAGTLYQKRFGGGSIGAPLSSSSMRRPERFSRWDRSCSKPARSYGRSSSLPPSLGSSSSCRLGRCGFCIS
jgi:drug/metabolite transporter (DMT)-like permease